MNADRIIIERVVSPLFDQNSYIVWKSGQSVGVVIDPGFDAESLIALIRSNQLKIVAIWLTHGHADHIIGLEKLKKEFPQAEIVIGENEKQLLGDSELNLSSALGFPVIAPEADRTVLDGEQFQSAGLTVKVLEVPGHSPGSVVYVIENQEPPVAFVGDVIFRNSVGRADFPGGDMHMLISGIREKVLKLPDNTVLYPGHGIFTTVGTEKASNPYVGDGSGLIGINDAD
jgi:hydroxyacylglutathione hydrolase